MDNAAILEPINDRRDILSGAPIDPEIGRLDDAQRRLEKEEMGHPQKVEQVGKYMGSIVGEHC